MWFDALGNYVNSLGYGTPASAPTSAPDLATWWTGSDRRIHVLGKGVLRFHAVYWPAMLLSAGLALPTDLLVHDYLTINGQKISKSSGTAVDPIAIADRYGVDAVRWWLLRDVPRIGDADFTTDRLELRAHEDLAGGFGNVVNRVVTMIHRFRNGAAPGLAATAPDDVKDPVDASERVPGTIDAALADADFRDAPPPLTDIVDAATAASRRPRRGRWPRPHERGWRCAARLDVVLAVLLQACRLLGRGLGAVPARRRRPDCCRVRGSPVARTGEGL